MASMVRVVGGSPLVVIVLLSCGGEARTDTSTQREVLLPSGGPDSLTVMLAARERHLMQTLADSGKDPSEHLSPHFTLVNAADSTDTITKDISGRQHLGFDYYKVFSSRISPKHAAIRKIEVLPQRAGHAVVITFHDSVPPTVTRWERMGATWKAVSMVVNVTEATVAAVRKRSTPKPVVN